MTNEDQEREAFEVTDAMMRAAMAQYNAGGNEGGLTKAVIRAALAAQAAPAGAQDGWIDVNDRKPEKNVEVLLAFRDTPLPATGQYTASDQDTWGWCFPKENDPDECGPVTHWQPLPEHPTPKPGWHLAARQQESKALANLRHLYENMIGGAVKDTASARRIATGLLGPAIEQIEREQRESAAAPAEGWDDLPKKLMDAARRDALTDADRVAIGRATVRIQESAAAPATGDTCHACKGAGGTMTGGVCAECYGQGTYEGARKFIASTQAEPSEVLAHEYRKGFIDGQIDMRDRVEPSEVERVDAAIVSTLLPQLYAVLDELVAKPDDKAATLKAKRMLPAQYGQSFAAPTLKETPK